MERMGRHGRVLGKTGNDIDRLDEQTKKKLLESSGIKDDDLEEEEKEGLLKVLLESRPDFLENQQNDENPEGSRGGNSSVQLSPDWTVGLNQHPTLSADDNIEDEDSTQPPEPIVLDSDETDNSPEQGQRINEAGKESDLKQDVGKVGSDDHEKRDKDRQSENGMQEGEDDMDENSRSSSPRLTGHTTLTEEKPLSNLITKDGVTTETDGTSRSGRQRNLTAEVVGQDSSDGPGEVDEETQAYDVNNQLVQDTQWPGETVQVVSPEPAIPESQSCESDEEDSTLHDSRLEKESTEISTSPKTCDLTMLQQNLNPLWPSLLTPIAGADKDCYSQVVKLMFELYMQRVYRKQRRLAETVAWGKPVEMGPHMDGCLRSKRGGRKLENPTEPRSLKERVLRRRGREAGKIEDDPYTIQDSNDEDADDFESLSRTKARRALGQVDRRAEEAKVSGRHLDLTEVNFKSAQVNSSQQEEIQQSVDSDTENTDEEWHPGPSRSRAKKRRPTPKAPKRVIEKSDPSLNKSKADEVSEVTNSASKSKARKRAAEDETAEGNLGVNAGAAQSEEENQHEVQTETGKLSKEDAHGKKHRLLTATKSDTVNSEIEEKVNLTNKAKFKFCTSSEEDSNQEPPRTQVKVSSTNQNDNAPRASGVEDCITLSDSDQSNGTSDAPTKPPDQPAREPRRGRSVMTQRTGPAKTVGQAISDVPITSKTSFTRSGKRTRPKPDREVKMGLSKGRKISGEVSGSPKELLSTDDENEPKLTEIKERGCDSDDVPSPENEPSIVDQVTTARPSVATSQESQIGGVSFSQNSNSLLDQNGDLYSTQISRNKPDTKVGAEKGAGKLRLRTALTVPGGSRKGLRAEQDEGHSSLPNSGIENHRKRRACGEATVLDELMSVADNVDGSSNEAPDSGNVEVLQEEVGSDSDGSVKRKTNGRTRQEVSLPVKKRRITQRQEVCAAQDQSGDVGPSAEVKEGGVVEAHRADHNVSSADPEREGIEVQAEPGGSADGDVEVRQLGGLEAEVDEQALTQCPICNKEFPLIDIEAHASTCGEEDVVEEVEPDPVCIYCRNSVAREGLREHQRNCARNEGSHQVGSPGTRPRRSRR